MPRDYRKFISNIKVHTLCKRFKHKQRKQERPELVSTRHTYHKSPSGQPRQSRLRGVQNQRSIRAQDVVWILDRSRRSRLRIDPVDVQQAPRKQRLPADPLHAVVSLDAFLEGEELRDHVVGGVTGVQADGPTDANCGFVVLVHHLAVV